MVGFSLGGSLAAFFALASTNAMAAPTYTASDFSKVRKFDSHVHANVGDDIFLMSAKKSGFEILSINVDYPDFPDLKTQADIAHKMKRAAPKRFHYTTTFSMKGFEAAGWANAVTKSLDTEHKKGAIGVKVWKNIGMVKF